MGFVGGTRLAVTTLTVFPLPLSKRDLTRNDAAWAMSLAPVVGLGLGGIAAGIAFVLSRSDLPPLPTAALLVAMLALLTRGMHLDGLADTADALGSYKGRDEALAIMKSPEIGPMGVAAIVGVMLIDASALTVLVQRHHWLAIVLGVAAGRIAFTAGCSTHYKAARPDGLGAFVAGTVAPFVWYLWALGLGALAMVRYHLPDLGSALVALPIAWVFFWHTSRRFGGITGDVLGAACEITVAATLLGFAAF